MRVDPAASRIEGLLAIADADRAQWELAHAHADTALSEVHASGGPRAAEVLLSLSESDTVSVKHFAAIHIGHIAASYGESALLLGQALVNLLGDTIMTAELARDSFLDHIPTDTLE